MTIRPVTGPIRLVEPEINHNLEQASALLDSYANHGNDSPPWDTCRDYLEEVRGALIMLELEGGIRLCHECLELLDALESKRALSHTQGLDLLVYAMLLMPRYIERARNQRQELPDTLLPTLNALRALRRCVLLPDYEFADFSQVDPELPMLLDTSCTAAGDLAQGSRRLRHIFQVGLLGLYRKPDSPIHAKQIRRALLRLSDVFGDSVTGRWLRLAFHVADYNVKQQLPANASIRLMLARLDQHVRKAARGDPDETPPHLVRQALLFYTMHGGESDQTLGTLRETLGLIRSLTLPAVLEHETQTMAAPDRTVMQAVSLALREDMDRLKSSIETLGRLSSISTGECDDLCEQLSSLGHTLTLLGLSEVAAEIRQEIGALRALGQDAGSRELGPVLSRAADTLTRGEEAVESLSDQSLGSSSGKKRPEGLRAAEHQAFGECMVNLSRVRNALEFLNGDVDEGEELSLIHPALLDVAGTLHVMGRKQAADLLERAGRHFHWLTPEYQGSEQLAALADTLASVEWYLEGLQEDAETNQDALEIGRLAMEALEEAGQQPPVKISQAH